MSKEGREKIKKIGKEGVKSIEASIRSHKKKANNAKVFGDTVAEEKHNKEVLRLEKRLEEKKKISNFC